ncbi:hypothetical protein [Candidatus Mycobacterium methanotrophicum]|uniref:Serine/threonine protein kinase n=1 Tax=Candidatus Mycobacterium methanotrophicum TaxID=2943498 RepID=A0ABY4QMD2_9MYCO|nr:hypothetical protein [Candidatus Mycobacterium methanotrophicum]UQX11672.1 hypothetical protein M5I08_04210 [Candidatus Mycobacterium methanotrophicum]
MPSSRTHIRHATAAAAAGWALFTLGLPLAVADPSTDALGFVDSTARCAAPDTAVVFGSTATSRVAICKTQSGKYEYRGVRISDGAKLVVPASASAAGGYVAESDGVTYTVTSSSLVVTKGNQVIHQEPMAYFHGPKTPAAPPTGSAPAAPPPTPTKPLPPPLPAEVGGSPH